MDSVWSVTADIPKKGPASHDIKTDVLIIGGGMAGILCAYQLQRSGISCVLAEADTICSGITKNTTAKITSQHGLIYAQLVRSFGVEQAQMYLSANESALAAYRCLCANIACDFEEKDAFVYALNSDEKIERELTALEKLRYPAELVQALPLPLPFPVAGAIRFPHQAQFNPLKFAAAIASGLNICERTRVCELTPRGAITNHGTIRAEKIIAATHFPFINKHGSYFLKLYQHRSYVLTLEHAPNIQGMYIDEAQTGMSFRNYQNLLLIGGGGHRTGKQGGNWQELAGFAAYHYPNAKETCRWATQDCMTLDGIPYIGQYSKRTPNFYVATGFNKWGMTSSMVAATILTDMVMGRENPNAEVFSPSRSILRPQLAANAFEAAANFLAPSKKRCPHLGCALKWNPQEHSWDCPCHGSRFSEDGTLIDNPATGNL